MTNLVRSDGEAKGSKSEVYSLLAVYWATGLTSIYYRTGLSGHFAKQ